MLIPITSIVKKILDSAHRPRMTDLLARLTSAEQSIEELKSELRWGEALADLVQQLQSLLNILERLASGREERADRAVHVPPNHRVTRAMKRRRSQAGV